MDRDNPSQALYAVQKRQSLRRKWNVLLGAYSALGLLTAFLGVGYFLLTLLPLEELSSKQRFALTTAGIGIALALMSRGLLAFWKSREAEETERLKQFESFYSFLDTWNRFEQIGKEALSREGQDVNKHSLRAVISKLYEEGKINKEDLNALDQALHIRNSIVHGEHPLPTEATEKAITLLLEIIRKLSARI